MKSSRATVSNKARERFRRLFRLPKSTYWRTTTFRLTLLFSALFAVGVIGLLGVIYWQTAGYMTRQVDLILNAQAQIYSAAKERDLPAKLDEFIREDARHIYYFGLFAKDGEPIAGNLEQQPVGLAMDGRIQVIEHHRDRGASAAEISIRALGVMLPSGAALVLARDVGPIDEIRYIILRALLWWGSLTLFLGALVGLSVGLGPLRRVAEIQRASQRVVRGDFTQRLPVAGRRDELDLLAGIVNTMLDEIERLLSEVKSVCDNVAHDLRTPLTRLRGQLYRMQQMGGAEGPQQMLLDNALADTDSLLARFRALLRISEIEDGRRRTGFASADLTRIVAQLADLYEPLAEDKDIRMKLNIGNVEPLFCDRELMFEALSNLVDNAIKFGPPSSVVEIVLSSSEAGARIEIVDQGPGIPAAERETILNRFFRSEQVRDLPGHGLGLSIVAAIVRLHGFDLHFESETSNGGTRAILRCARGGLPDA